MSGCPQSPAGAAGGGLASSPSCNSTDFLTRVINQWLVCGVQSGVGGQTGWWDAQACGWVALVLWHHMSAEEKVNTNTNIHVFLAGSSRVTCGHMNQLKSSSYRHEFTPGDRPQPPQLNRDVSVCLSRLMADSICAHFISVWIHLISDATLHWIQLNCS